ncbi:hypothetical protein [Pseudonocardia terrae]|nr:hypothetical protein [Pseudonocardia terrae]
MAAAWRTASITAACSTASVRPNAGAAPVAMAREPTLRGTPSSAA